MSQCVTHVIFLIVDLVSGVLGYFVGVAAILLAILSLVPLDFCWRAYYLLDPAKHYSLADTVLLYLVHIGLKIVARIEYQKLITDTE